MSKLPACGNVCVAVDAGGDDNKANEGELTFDTTSSIKRRHYDWFKLFDQVTVDEMDNDQKITDNLHFVLTLNILADTHQCFFDCHSN